MIIDAFIFYNEVDLLHMRLEELYPVVDKFILVQAFHTFRGVYKEKSFDKHDPQWAPYIDKITDICVGLSGGKDAWERERYQRNVISMELQAGYSLNDIVIISDLDEIPRREVVAGLGELDTPVALGMPHDNYGLNCLYPGPWFAAKALRVRDVTTAEEIRQAQFPIIENAGWHFSYFGDDEFISNKFRSFSHSEVDTPLVHSRIAENRKQMLDPHNHGQPLTIVEVDETWPHAVRSNPDFWRKYIWPPLD
jgi:beta-1,4-mannosyl-glycoprotein beta-1,4-N-acetylglucosaminyltransferase